MVTIVHNDSGGSITRDKVCSTYQCPYGQNMPENTLWILTYIKGHQDRVQRNKEGLVEQNGRIYARNFNQSTDIN